MRILQVCAYAAQYGGNFIASLTALEKNLISQGYCVEYVFPCAARNFEWCKAIEKRTKVYYCSSNRFSVNTYFQIKHAMKQADIIHSHFELYDILTALAKTKRQTLVWHLHDSFDDHIDLFHRIVNNFQYGMMGKKAFLISPNEYYANYVADLGFPAKNISIVPNCIDFKRLKKQNIAKKTHDFLVFGGFFYIKGLDILLDACRILVKKGKQFSLGVVGYADTWNWIDSNYPDLNQIIHRIAPSEDVLSFYESSKVFLCTSRRECFSYALTEALYVGLPAIVSNIPGNIWCKKYSAVSTFTPESPLELADAMQKYIDSNYSYDPEKLHEVSELIAEEYGLEKWISQIEEVYFES